MILKSALRQLKKNKFMNTLIVIQLAAVMTILYILVCTVESRMVYYKPFADEINSQGYLCNIDIPVSENEITKSFNGAKCEFTYSGFYTVNLTSNNISDDEQDKYHPDTAILSDKWINAYTPQLQSGSWLNNLPEDEYIHAVVTPDNPFGFKTGDVVTIFNEDGKLSEKVKIIGTMDNKQYIVGYSAFSQTDVPNRFNFFDMYYTFNSQVEDGWGLCIPKSEIEQSSLYDGDFAVRGMCFIICDGMSEGKVNEIYESLSYNYSPTYTKSLDEIKTNSFVYINEQLYILLPIAICIFLLLLITTISVISISINKQLKTYATFYICGAKWRDCAFISFIYSLIMSIIAGVISFAAIFIIMQTSLTVIKSGIFEVAAMLIAVIIYLILSAVMPLVIIGKTQPKEILNKDK